MTEFLQDIKLTSALVWHGLLQSRTWIDRLVYFLPEWYRTWEENGYGEAHCLYAEIEGVGFLYPFLYCPVAGYDLLGDYYDVETAYGYGGVLVTELPSEAVASTFNRLIDSWMCDHRVIAEFVRLFPEHGRHPIRNLDYHEVRRDLFLDISGRSSEDLWAGLLSAKTRNTIRKAEREGLHAVFDKEMDDLSAFIQMYDETARRLTMAQFYRFPYAYFDSLRTTLRGVSMLVNVFKENKIIASSVWLRYGNRLHYYLGAASDSFRHLPCADTYIWATVCNAVMDGSIQTVHYGGGMSIDPKDSLSRFKAKYADRAERVYVGTRVHLYDVYEQVCHDWERKYPNQVLGHGHKLLRYRHTGDL